jgi:hypothetical protein
MLSQRADENVDNPIAAKSLWGKLPLTDTIRAFEWWEFKLAPIFATVYATAYLFDVSLASLWQFFILLLFALAPGAAFVSVINDLTDLEEDRLAGKRNRLEGKSKAYIFVMLSCCIALGLAICYYLRNHLLTVSLYLSAWIAYSLYSFPPVRLKTRGFLGVLADASGAHLLPQLITISALTYWCGKQLDFAWFIAVSVWALFCGIRGILWHQLKDKQNDELAGATTFGQLHDSRFIQRLGERIIFPTEVVAFVFMLFYTRNIAAFLLLAFYGYMVWLRYRLWLLETIIVLTKKKYRIALHEYYEFFYPLAFLIVACIRRPFDLVVLVGHLILFPRQMILFTYQVFKAHKDLFGYIVNRIIFRE